MQNIFSDGVDVTSINLCVTTLFLKIMSHVTADDAASIATALAAITTILYNIQKIHKDRKKK